MLSFHSHLKVFLSTDPCDLRASFNGQTRMLAELNSTNAGVVTSILWGNDLSGTQDGAGGVGGILAINYGVDGLCFPSYDGNGNVCSLVSATDGSVSGLYEYGPFGELIRLSGLMCIRNQLRFGTKYSDGETDLINFGLPHYKPSSGTWVSRDPIGEHGGINLYGMLANGAVNDTDAIGLQGTIDPRQPPTEDVEFKLIQESYRILEDLVEKWRELGWQFAADNLQHFLKSPDRDFNAYKHHQKVADDPGWRATAWKHFNQVASTTPWGTIGEKALASIPPGGNVVSPDTLTVYFQHRFGTRYDALLDQNELFYALYGSSYSYYGRLCKSGTSWQVDIKMVLIDPLTYPPGQYNERLLFPQYLSANRIELYRKRVRPPYVYAVWSEHFDSNRSP